jgi:hypothetical protein
VREGKDEMLEFGMEYFKRVDSRMEAAGAQSVDGIMNTCRSSGANWLSLIGGVPVGEGELAFDQQTKHMFEEGQIEGIPFIITYLASCRNGRSSLCTRSQCLSN